MFYILEEGQVYPYHPCVPYCIPPIIIPVLFCLVDIPGPYKAFCPGMANGGWGRVRTLSGLRIYWHDYLKRLSLAPSSHCRRWTLILCAGTLDPRMHRCVDHTKVMATLLLTYPHVLD